MRKIFLFFAFIGISLGLILGVRNAMINKEINQNVQTNLSGDIYVHELSIPIMEIDSLNPILTDNKHIMNIMNLIYEPLVSIGENEKLIAVLATEWAKKDDSNWIIKLRKGVRWHNGNQFTTADVIFTINQILNGSFESIYRDNLTNIDKIDKIDDYSINISLKEKDEFFIYKLIIPIIPEYYFKNGDILNEHKNNYPVGTGAYKYVSTNEADAIIRLEKNKAWWNMTENTKLDTIFLHCYPTYGEAIKAYKSAEVDLITTTMSDWKKKFGTIGNNNYTYESSIFDTIIPNTEKLALSDSSVRKAILTAINRENIVSKIFDSNATIVDFPIHTRSQNYLGKVETEYSMDKAKHILLNAGWTNNTGIWTKEILGKNCKLKFDFLVNLKNDEHIRTAEIIKENLQDIGIEIIIKKVEWNEYEKAIKDGNFELALASYDIKNELVVLDMLKSANNYNYARYSNINMNAAVQDVKNNYNKDTMQKLQQLYKEETPYIGLHFRNDTLITNKSVKGGIEPIWSNPYLNITSWCK